MRIIKQNDDLMVLKDQTGFWSFLIGIIFVVVGLISTFSPHLFKQSSPLWAGFIFVLFGLLSIFLGKSTTIIIDKISGKMSILYKGIFGTPTTEYLDLTQIKQIKISNKNIDRLYVLSFILDSGREIQFSGLSSSYKSKRKFAERVAAFINIPIVEDFDASKKDTIIID